MASSKRVPLPSLPSDLIEAILYRTPAESLIRFKSICKKWYDLISNNKRFIYNHLNHSPERFLRIDKHQTVEIMDPVNIIQSDSQIPYELRVSHPIMSMIQCDGLMLCICGDLENKELLKHVDLAVWNPVTRKIKCIEPSVSYRIYDYFGFGYNNTCRDNYKISRFLYPPYITHKVDTSVPECEIYEFKSDSWKSLNAKFDWLVDSECKGVSVKGNMYWLAIKEKSFIISFDFSMETFKDICACPPYCQLQQLGCSSGDRLSLLRMDQDDGGVAVNEIEVWMTNKLSDEVVSFTKYFNVNTPDLPPLLYRSGRPRTCYSIGKYRNIMAWSEGNVKKMVSGIFAILFTILMKMGLEKKKRQEDDVMIVTTTTCLFVAMCIQVLFQFQNKLSILGLFRVLKTLLLLVFVY